MDSKRKMAYGTTAAVASFLGGAKLIEFRLLGTPIPVLLEDINVSIHVPTINEEGWIKRCMDSLTSQDLYKQCDDVKIVLVDSGSTDCTVQIAQPYVDEVFTVSRGKLNARHEAILMDKADIIVSTDADCTHPPAWLSNLLAPFADPEVVATHGPCLSTDPIWKPFRAWWSDLFQNQLGRISARNSAFRRWAYLKTGGFNLEVDQYDRDGALNREEEHDFRTRLEQVGKVVFVHALVYTSDRQMPLTTERGHVEKYRAEQKAGIRF